MHELYELYRIAIKTYKPHECKTKNLLSAASDTHFKSIPMLYGGRGKANPTFFGLLLVAMTAVSAISVYL